MIVLCRMGYEQEHQNHRQDQNQYAQDHAGVINRQHKIIQSVYSHGAKIRYQHIACGTLALVRILSRL